MSLRNCSEDVEAALLNSDGDPKEEVREALRVIAKFAHQETEMGIDLFKVMAEEAFLRAEMGCTE